jgi:hypothetical protein
MTDTTTPPALPVRPQDLIDMANALERNGDHDLALIIRQKFPDLFPPEA